MQPDFSDGSKPVEMQRTEKQKRKVKEAGYMEKSREFIQKLTYDINNGETMELIQRGHDGTVLISDNSTSKTEYIPAGDMVMLINFYRYIKDNDIQNDFINYNGKN